MNRLIAQPYLQAFIAGAIAVLGFAPFGIFPLPILALVALFWLWSRAERPTQAAGLGFAFGMGLFCAGVGWIYVALHDYGYMHPVLAALATALFAAVNAALPALAGYAPVLGVYGVSLLVALSAGMALLVWNVRGSKLGNIVLGAVLTIWLGGTALRMVAWTAAQGEPIKVGLLQGNIAQDEKFDEDRLIGTLETYRRLAQASDARLIVLPETALPLLRRDVPEYYQALLGDLARKNGGDILIGAFEKEQGAYYNSVYSLGSAESQHYRKNHLVPFGEFIPLRSVFGWLINGVLHIPMGDQASGGAQQPPLNVAGQKVAVNICYEDAFGEEIIRALPAATLLVNVTNDAWYGDSHAAMQHNQLSQMRALETGRMVLRATNTGVTSIIGPDGRIQAMLPQHEEGVLTAAAQGYTGSTPYVLWGNAAMLVLAGVMLGAAWRVGRRK